MEESALAGMSARDSPEFQTAETTSKTLRLIFQERPPRTSRPLKMLSSAPASEDCLR